MKVLVIEDDALFSGAIKEYLALNDHTVSICNTVDKGISKLKEETFDLVLTDIQLPGKSGMYILEHIASHHPNLAVIVMTGYASLESAIDALRLKAVDYLIKPFDLLLLSNLISETVEKSKMPISNDDDMPLKKYGIIGSSKKLEELSIQINQIASSDFNVLISGESGTGKELTAYAIHSESKRKQNRYVTLNCASLEDSLFTSEMFGHKKGSFTGATASNIGYLEAANGGTIFLDEIGDLCMQSQVKLLRVLETGEFNPVGNIKPKKVDVRVISASNRDLEKEIKKGDFRLDLYYRLNTFQIELPPLRERKEDIPFLAKHFTDKHVPKFNTDITDISSALMDRMHDYSWPGNIRELEHMIIRGISQAKKGARMLTDIPIPVLQERGSHTKSVIKPLKSAAKQALLAFEQESIEEALKKTDGNVSLAAKELNLDRATLYRKINKSTIDLDSFRPHA